MWYAPLREREERTMTSEMVEVSRYMETELHIHMRTLIAKDVYDSMVIKSKDTPLDHIDWNLYLLLTDLLNASEEIFPEDSFYFESDGRTLLAEFSEGDDGSVSVVVSDGSGA
jgi:hypothetical protein